VYALICDIATWIVIIVCWRIMKKIQPELSKPYLVYEICIGVILTLFLAWYEFWG